MTAPRDPDSLSNAARQRRKRMVAHVAKSHREADDWDLRFWQSRTPQERLSALTALRNDLKAIHGDKTDFDWEGD